MSHVFKCDHCDNIQEKESAGYSNLPEGWGRITIGVVFTGAQRRTISEIRELCSNCLDIRFSDREEDPKSVRENLLDYLDDYISEKVQEVFDKGP
jgi:hypothetical protein